MVWAKIGAIPKEARAVKVVAHPRKSPSLFPISALFALGINVAQTFIDVEVVPKRRNQYSNEGQGN